MNFLKKYVVVGAGKTGMSCIKFLEGKVQELIFIDENFTKDKIKSITSQYPNVICENKFKKNDLKKAFKIILSPGISINNPYLEPYRGKIISDIELFLSSTDKPIIAITGTNGKSTVVTLVGEILQEAGYKVRVGGNLGIPALDLLDDDIDIYALELSSFQLELLDVLEADVACILNITPDHLDRHLSMENYISIKQKIYKKAKRIIVNRDDLLTYPSFDVQYESFGLSEVFSNKSTGITKDEKWLMQGTTKIVKTSELLVYGKHNWSNLLAVISICSAYKVSISIMKKVILSFSGLKHRCQVIRNLNNTVWINDSKSTNVGSIQASVSGFSKKEKGIILILGGASKGESFLELRELLEKNVRLVILFGRDAKVIEQQIMHETILNAIDLQDVVNIAYKNTKEGDIVLFSPGCTSFDMFQDYIHRGNEFTKIVHKLR